MKKYIDKVKSEREIDKEEIIQRIKEIFFDVTDINAGDIERSSLLYDLGIDSFTALEILASVEQKFNIAIDKAKLAKIRTFEDIVNLIGQYLER